MSRARPQVGHGLRQAVGGPAVAPATARPDQLCDGDASPATVLDVALYLSQITEADELLTNDPLALLIGMVLDQPVSEG